MIFSEEIGESLTIKFAQEARKINKMGMPVISLGMGEPDFDTPLHIVEATIQAMRGNYGRYSDAMGLFELREAIAQKLCRQNSINARAENIVVAPGAKQAIVLALMAILEPGDEVINFTPSWVSYVPMIKIAEPGAIIKNLPMQKDSYDIDLDLLASTINTKTRLIIINTPHNPTGRMLNREQLESIAALAQKNKLYILSDEVYELLNFSGKVHHSLASFPGMEDLTITINGFSKAYAMTGWRIGYMLIPDPLTGKIVKLQQHINTNTCTFIQKGAVAALTGSHRHLETYNEELKIRAGIISDWLKRQKYISGVSPEGGFFTFIDISKTGLSSNDFSAHLIKETLVASTPGIAFGKDWDSHIRLSFAVNSNSLIKALELIAQLVEQMAEAG